MKLALAQLNYTVSDFVNNEKKIINAIQKAEDDNCQLVVFSETSVCGYLPFDLLTYEQYIIQCDLSLKNIAEHSKNITVIIGAPTTNKGTGKRLFNSAIIIQNKKILKTINKTLIPYYDIFNEQRYFEKRHTNDKTIKINDLLIAITICEDIWFKDSLYYEDTIKELANLKPDLTINISASPFDKDQYNNRISVVTNAAKSIQSPIIYVNQVGANTNLIFDGNSIVCDKHGKIIQELKSFQEDFIVIEFDNHTQNFTSDNTKYVAKTYNKNDNITKALILGIQDYFRKTKFSKAILGLSGGIDSALTLAIASLALGKDNVKAILMPSEFSSKHSISDSIALVENIGCNYTTISINSLYNAFLDTLKTPFSNTEKDVTEENLQARIRANILLALANKFDYLVLNTSNKSELAVGYGTLYGDMCGAISVLGDLYKSEVYELARYINSAYNNLIPENIITKEPSAELSPNQKDSDTLPDYNLLDQILTLYIDNKLSTLEIINRGFPNEIVNRVISLININEYKRSQFPPILRVSKNCFSDAWKMPIAKNLW